MEKGQSVLEQVRESYYRIGKPGHVLLALSGGADSVALMHILIALKEEEGFTLSCIHVNHGIRAASEDEQEWVTNLSAKFRFPLIVKRVAVSFMGNQEANARKSRYTAFREAMAESNADALALAHHANDQAETLLMHLLRGSGSDGLAGMKLDSLPLWRPLLPVSKKQIIAYLHAVNAVWIEDESNRDPGFLRNRLRLQLLPLMEDISPGTVLRMAKSAAILQDERDFFSKTEDKWLSLHGNSTPPFVYLNRQPFSGQHPALQRRLVRRLCSEYGILLDYGQTERLRLFTEGESGNKYMLPGKAMAQKSEKRLHIIPNEIESYHVPWPQPLQCLPGESLGDGLREQVFDAEQVTGALMRQTQAGDRITPLGMNGSQSMLKYLSARRVDQPFRRFWPVFARDSEVLWVPGCGAAQPAAVTAKTCTRVRFSFLGELPGEKILEAM